MPEKLPIEISPHGGRLVPAFIDVAMALRMVALPDTVDSNSATGISDDAAEVLADYPGAFSLAGLTDVSPAAVRFLLSGKSPRGLFLDGIVDLQEPVARELARARGWISLRGLKSLDPAVAAHLSCIRPALLLRGLESLSVGAAAALSNQRKWLYLDGVVSMDADVAAALGRYRREWLSLDGIKELSDEAAVSLARQAKWLSLKGLERVPPQGARALLLNGRVYTSLDLYAIATQEGLR